MTTQSPKPTNTETIQDVIQERYGDLALAERENQSAVLVSEALGYSKSSLSSVPDDANLGVGCGNPIALASLQLGETVVDLGAGAGLDSLIAAKAVGPQGRVIGVDMTSGMLASARKNAVAMNVHAFVEFREGRIEELPVASNSADVVISNCVINLCPDKQKAFDEAYRVLKPGGRLALSDIVLSAALPKEVSSLIDAYVSCLSSASTEAEYLSAMKGAGFVDIEFTRVPAGELFLEDHSDPMIQQGIMAIGKERATALSHLVWSYRFTARKT